MFMRFVVLRDIACNFHDMKIHNVVLLASFKRIIDPLYTKLKEHNDIVLKMQLHLCTIHQVCAHFDSMLDMIPTVATGLNQLI